MNIPEEESSFAKDNGFLLFFLHNSIIICNFAAAYRMRLLQQPILQATTKKDIYR